MESVLRRRCAADVQEYLFRQDQVPSGRHRRRWQAVCQGGEQAHRPRSISLQIELMSCSDPQLLNRNPKHRLGAERDAAELKEHPFFKSIDWRLLAAKQITPPFKPMVESDESVSNFDPLFTSSDLRDVPFDWSASDDTLMSGSVGHSYNGPGGGISVDRTGKPSSQASGMNIKPTRPGLVPTGSPLTSSVQANFRGFTYTGESMAVSSGTGR